MISKYFWIILNNSGIFWINSVLIQCWFRRIQTSKYVWITLYYKIKTESIWITSEWFRMIFYKSLKSESIWIISEWFRIIFYQFLRSESIWIISEWFRIIFYQFLKLESLLNHSANDFLILSNNVMFICVSCIFFQWGLKYYMYMYTAHLNSFEPAFGWVITLFLI